MNTIIGMEFHIRLNTRTKAFSDVAIAAFDDPPNTAVDAVTAGEPGSLPVVNKSMVDKGLMLALACNANIADTLEFDRKHYFYPDLPKGYQITQHRKPLATGGALLVMNADGIMTELPLLQLHLEEDSAKTVITEDNLYLDLNRAGNPLLEMVTAAEIRNAAMAVDTFHAVQNLVRYLLISDARPEEGSFRCDANISVADNQGISSARVEIKNINSTAALKSALEYEENRLKYAVEAGISGRDETRCWDEKAKQTVHERYKESEIQYRYLPEWDLPPVSLGKEYTAKLAKELPEHPAAVFKELVSKYGISIETATVVSNRRLFADIVRNIQEPEKTITLVTNWLKGPLRTMSECDPEVAGKRLSELAGLVLNNKINDTSAREIMSDAVTFTKGDAEMLALNKNKLITTCSADLINLVEHLLAEYPAEVRLYREGKKVVFGFLMGRLMQASQGRIDPREASELLRNKLETDERNY